MYVDQSHAYRSKQVALEQLSNRIQDERTDERRLIAADLHDEVMQPLFKVSLLGHVLKTDLATGRLLAMDQDLPELLMAAEVASNSLRDLIGDLRKSTLGRGGLTPALKSLAQGLSTEVAPTVHVNIHDVSGDDRTELAIYQIAKEALSNAISHSKAQDLWIEIDQGPDGIVLTVRDNGVGFKPYESRTGHYGLSIMRERAELVGGFLTIDSDPGHGCLVTLAISPYAAPR
jgi:two-component system nitrate/nitrite sensor histidine kinase NarX